MNAMERFIEELLIAVPEVRAIYKEHMKDNDTLLPHVFMGDVTRFALQLGRSASSQEVLRKLLVLVEAGLKSNESDVANLVAVSFVENLCGEDEAVVPLIPLLGEATRRELRSLCGMRIT
jgi:hypothetical protein